MCIIISDGESSAVERRIAHGLARTLYKDVPKQVGMRLNRVSLVVIVSHVEQLETKIVPDCFGDSIRQFE